MDKPLPRHTDLSAKESQSQDGPVISYASSDMLHSSARSLSEPNLAGEELACSSSPFLVVFHLTTTYAPINPTFRRARPTADSSVPGTRTSCRSAALDSHRRPADMRVTSGGDVRS